MKPFVFLARLGLIVFLLSLIGCLSSGAPPVHEEPGAVDQDVLVVGITPNARPLIFKEGGKIKGVEADLAREFAKFLNMKLRFVELAWEEEIPALLAGKIDIIMSGISITKLRSYRINFSEPYFRTGQMMLVRLADVTNYPRGYYDLKWKQGITVGDVAGTTSQEFVTRNVKRAKKRSFNNSDNAVAALLRGNIDVFVYDAPVVMMYGAAHEGQLAPVYTLLTEEYLAWGMGKESTNLQQLANTFLAQSRKNGHLEAILAKWLPLVSAQGRAR